MSDLSGRPTVPYILDVDYNRPPWIRYVVVRVPIRTLSGIVSSGIRFVD